MIELIGIIIAIVLAIVGIVLGLWGIYKISTYDVDARYKGKA